MKYQFLYEHIVTIQIEEQKRVVRVQIVVLMAQENIITVLTDRKIKKGCTQL